MTSHMKVTLEGSKPSIHEDEFSAQRPGPGDHLVTIYRSWPDDHRNEVETKLLRKIDLRILPVLVVMYILNYMDRTSVAQARLYGIEEELGITGALWQTGISILSVSYILTQIPATLLIAKSRPSILLPGCMLIWALVSACTGATSNTAGFLAVRFCLGIAEGPFFPSAIYFLSCWYRKKELGVRIALLMSGLVSSQAFAGLVSAGILKGMDGTTKLAAWRWLFILEGVFTAVLAVLAFFALPDYPATTKWLSDDEKICAMARLADDIGSESLVQEVVPMTGALLMAVRDYRVWLLACLQMANTACISFSNFFPTLVHDMGFDNNTTVLLITAPPYVLGFVSVILISYVADRIQVRSIPAATSMIVAVGAGIAVIALGDHSPWARYGLMFPMVCGVYSTYCVTYTWLSSTIVRPPMKRAAAIGIANTCANSAVLFGNYFWLDRYSPTYIPSWACIIAFGTLSVICALSLRMSLRSTNKKFDKLELEVDSQNPAQIGSLDEIEQRAVLAGFRYVT